MTTAFLLAFIKIIGLDLFLRIITTFPCYGVVGLAMESRLCLQIDEEEAQFLIVMMMSHSYDSVAQA